MTQIRKYRLVGDRWALLVLRHLHAGPARFGEIKAKNLEQAIALTKGNPIEGPRKKDVSREAARALTGSGTRQLRSSGD
jgi:hypothetical protein